MSSPHAQNRSKVSRAMALGTAASATATLLLGALVALPGVASATTPDATIVITAGSHLLDTSETRSKGHNDFLVDGLHVWTEDATSQAKAAGYLAHVETLSSLIATGDPTLDWTNDSGRTALPGKQLVVDFDGTDGPDGILIGEPVYGANWWLNNLAEQFVKDGAPTHGGGGSPWNGTLQEWSAAFPSAQIAAVGYSMGSGVLGGGVINSMTYGTTTYEFALGIGNTVVDDDGKGVLGDCNNPTVTAPTTIQAAISLAAAGDTVSVCAGSYTESITVDKPLTLHGAQAGNDARVGRTDTAAESVIHGSLNANGISGTTIDGFWFTDSQTNVSIALYNGTSGHTVRNTVIDGNDLPAIEAAIIYTADGTSPTLFERNRVTGGDQHGFFATPEASNVTIRDNAFAGNGSSVVHFAPAVGVSSNVVVSGNTSTGDGNFIVGSGVNNLTVDNNTVTGTTGTGMLFGGDFSNVTISHNTVSGSAFTGISMTSDFGAANTGFTIAENTITGNLRGISFGSGGYTGTAQVHFNRLVDNYSVADGRVGVRNLSGGAINAEDNWWGCNEGPGNVDCDNDLGVVDSAPRLVLTTTAADSTVSATTTVTADLTRNSAGNDRSAVGTIPATPVMFATTSGALTEESAVLVDGIATTTLKRAGAEGAATVSSTVDHETATDSVTFVAPELTVQSRTIGESAGTANVTVSLDLPNDVDVTFHYETAYGSAGSADFTATSGDAVIPAGSTTFLIPISVTPDSIDEANETFDVTISDASVGIATDTAQITIIDDDASPVVNVSDSGAPVKEKKNVVFTVSLSEASPLQTSVNVTTQNGTAQAPGDFKAVTKTVVFAPGQTSKTVKVKTKKDGLTEVLESFTLELSSPVFLTIGDSTGVGTIKANGTLARVLKGTGI